MVAPATPSPKRAGGVVPRRRFQKGMMVIRGTKHPQRCGLYREDILLKDGTLHRARPTVRLGPVSELSERAARAKFQPYLDRVNSAVERPPKSGMTLHAFVQEWRANIAGNLEASTVRAAESHLRAHIIPILGALRLVEMNPKVIQAFVTSMATSGLSRKTVENVLLTLSSLLRTARAWGYACGARGFIRGTRLRFDGWAELLNDPDHGECMIPMMMLYHEHDEDLSMRPKPTGPEQREKLYEFMATGLLPAYRYFRRYEKVSESTHYLEFLYTQVKIGRNDPCPCGSGKKYKRCCGGATVQ